MYHTKTVAETLAKLQTTEQGLTNSEAIKRLNEYGENTIKLPDVPLWKKLIEPFADIFTLVLFVAIAISLWQHEILDAVIISGIIVINAIIYYIQRFSTDRILRSLQEHDRTIVDTVRNNKTLQLNASQLVPGDIILMEEGEKVPADCRIIDSSSLRTDESQLTGESLPIDKQSDAVSDDAEIYERSNMVYQGSFVVGGQCKAIIVATGNHTEFGKLAKLSVRKEEPSPIQKRITRLINLLIRLIMGIAVMAFILSLFRGMSVSEAVRYVLALSVSAVPESLPIAITVVLVLGMRRMAKKKALVKNLNAIETIGIVTVIASDKTGTLTKNQLTVRESWNPKDDSLALLDSLKFAVNTSISKTVDPLDGAIARYLDSKHIKRRSNPIVVLPFEQVSAMSGNIYHAGKEYELFVKGAPEHVVEKCHLSKRDRKKINAKLHELASKGYRVIAVAHQTLDKPFDTFSDYPKDMNLTLDGFIAIADILRPEAITAIKKAQNAGIRVCMITGDHFETAFHIARELNIVKHPSEVFDSRQMKNLNDKELTKIIEKVRVFARVLPENKHRLLNILNATHITAMTGDGVNDVPALTEANVGLAMGDGSSIAKDAGDIILLNNNFRSIVDAVHEGRTIYANIKRMVAYLLSTNAGEVLTIMASLAVGIPVPVLPVQILWINLVTDTCMVIPIGLEPGERRNMLTPPKPANANLFSKFFLTRIATTALTMAFLTLALYMFFLPSHGLEYARTIAFHALVVMQLASAFGSRSDYEPLHIRIRRPNPAFYIGLLVAIFMQALAMSSILNAPLGLVNLSLYDFTLVIAIAFIVPLMVIELHKWIGRRFFNKGSANVRKRS